MNELSKLDLIQLAYEGVLARENENNHLKQTLEQMFKVENDLQNSKNVNYVNPVATETKEKESSKEAKKQ